MTLLACMYPVSIQVLHICCKPNLEKHLNLLHDISQGTCHSASRQAWHLHLRLRKGFVLTSGTQLASAKSGSTQIAAGANTCFHRDLFKEPWFNGRHQCLKSVQLNWRESCAEFAAQAVQITSRKVSQTSRQRDPTSWKKSPQIEIRCFHEAMSRDSLE